MLDTRGILLVGAGMLLLLSPAAQADGLSQFKTLIEAKMPPGALTYGSASTLGNSGFELRDVVLTPTPEMNEAAKTAAGPKPVPIKIQRIVVDDFDFDGPAHEKGPDFLRMRAEGVAVTANAYPDLEMVKYFGTDHVTADITLEYRNEPQRQVFTLNRLEFNLQGLARLEIGMVLDGVKDLWAPDSGDVKLRTATVVYEDASLLGKLLPALAAQQKLTPEAVVAMGTAGVEMIRAGQGPETMAILDALNSYIADYRQPKGPLRISINPKTQATAADLDKLTNPNALADQFGIKVTYAGTVPHGTSPAPSASPRPAVVASLSGCAAGTRFFVLSDGAWWASTAREATVSGRCVVKLDGSDKGEEVTAGNDELIAWSIDGPGNPIAGCKKGDVVLGLSDGAWYPAKVKATPAASKGCPVHYDDFDDDEDETLPLKNIRVLTR